MTAPRPLTLRLASALGLSAALLLAGASLAAAAPSGSLSASPAAPRIQPGALGSTRLRWETREVGTAQLYLRRADRVFDPLAARAREAALGGSRGNGRFERDDDGVGSTVDTSGEARR